MAELTRGPAGAAGGRAPSKLEVGAANSPAEHQADAVAGAVTGNAAPQQLIVDDAAPVADGQMNRNAFIAALKPQVMKAAEEELGFIRSIVGCPYIEKYFNLYSQRDARTIESAARKFAPGTRNAKTANEMIGRSWPRSARGEGLGQGRLADRPIAEPRSESGAPPPAGFDGSSGNGAARPSRGLPAADRPEQDAARRSARPPARWRRPPRPRSPAPFAKARALASPAGNVASPWATP